MPNLRNGTEKPRSVDPPPEHDFCFGIGHDPGAKIQTTRTRRAVLQLDLIRRHDVRKHSLQLVCKEETSRTTNRSHCQTTAEHEENEKPIPRMRTIAPDMVLDARRDELMFLWLLHINESEGPKLFGVLVEPVVVVEPTSGDADRRAFWDERST